MLLRGAIELLLYSHLSLLQGIFRYVAHMIVQQVLNPVVVVTDSTYNVAAVLSVQASRVVDVR